MLAEPHPALPEMVTPNCPFRLAVTYSLLPRLKPIWMESEGATAKLLQDMSVQLLTLLVRVPENCPMTFQ